VNNIEQDTVWGLISRAYASQIKDHALEALNLLRTFKNKTYVDKNKVLPTNAQIFFKCIFLLYFIVEEILPFTRR